MAANSFNLQGNLPYSVGSEGPDAFSQLATVEDSRPASQAAIRKRRLLQPPWTVPRKGRTIGVKVLPFQTPEAQGLWARDRSFST